MIQLDLNQQAAKARTLSWFFNRPRKPIFKIFGYAGVGKTTIVNQIIEDIDGLVLHGAYTGKAAEVMNQHGLDAKTIHSLIYKPIPRDKMWIEELKERLEKITDKLEIAELKESLTEARALRFMLNDNSRLWDAKLLVLDECSMIDEEMLSDLLTFGVPLLVLGDPGQLPPIKGTGALVRGEPDVMLTEIHRQAKDNPIINLSWKARLGKKIDHGIYGASSCVPIQGLSASAPMQVDQVLTGKNDTRRGMNIVMRKQMGLSGVMPQVGEKLICLRNHSEINLQNGTLCTVLEVGEVGMISTMMKLRTNFGHEVETLVHRVHFEEYTRPGLVKSLEWWDLKKADEFDFGYVITVHKAQGSQWNSVMLYDDGFLNWKQVERQRWLYTGITRAVKSIVIVS